MVARSPFASSSVVLHVVRGLVGLVAFVAGIAGLGAIGPSALLLLLVAGIAWRGCPTCWVIGLAQTRARCGCAGVANNTP